MPLHIIYTTQAMLLSREPFSSWQEIQDRHADYQASLGPWSEAEVIDYLTAEYPDLSPDAATQVALLRAGPALARPLSTRAPLAPDANAQE